MTQTILLPLVGFLVGVLIISLGGGGGLIYVGILTAFFHVPPAVAASTSLATIIPTTAMGAFSHWRAGNVNLRYGLTMLAGGAAGSVAGSLCSGLLPQRLYARVTAVVMLALALQMLISYLRRRRRGAAGADAACRRPTPRALAGALFFGLLGGGMSGLIGLSGGGPVIAGLAILGCGALETVGTSVLVLLGISVTGFAAHLGLGSVDWKLVALLACGTVAGAFTGPVLLKKFDRTTLERVLQPALIALTVFMGGLLLFQ